MSQNGIINLIHSDAQRDAYARRGNAMILNGAGAHLLDREEVRKRLPFLNYDDARFPIKGGLMQPRAGMAAISDDATVEEMIAAAKKIKHRRLPIYDETPDTIVGILNTRALLLDPKIDLADAIEFPSFVPETMNLLQLFQSLQKQQRGLAIVLDEFGGTAGLVTMEDILGRLIGKIHAVAQPEGFVMEKISPDRWRVSGTMRLDDFRREFPALGDVPEVETMGGLLTHLRGVVPEAGESASFRGLKLTAHAVDERRVRELMVQRVR